MLTLVLAAVLLGAPTSPKDTLIQVRQGDHLVLSEFSGTIGIEAWGRSELRAEADADEALQFRFSRSGNRIELEVLDRKNRNRTEELRLRVPLWMNLEISGRKLDVEVDGLGGEVRIRNLKGDFLLEDLSGRIDAATLEGSIDALRLEGTARLKTGDGDITVMESGADLELETVSGDIEVLGSASPNLEARTTDGDVDFSGRLSPAGVYAIRSHGGELTLTLDAPVDTDVTVLVYEGEFKSDFPVRARGYQSGKDLEFTIGEGGSRLLLEAFDGEVTLRKAGS